MNRVAEKSDILLEWATARDYPADKVRALTIPHFNAINPAAQRPENIEAWMLARGRKGTRGVCELSHRLLPVVCLLNQRLPFFCEFQFFAEATDYIVGF